MSAITAQHTKWRIGEWTACADSDTLFSGESQFKLERRAMETLVVLAARAGEVVKKEELIVAVWGRLAVSDHSVAMVISQLRKAFGDDARAPRYIETITKRGYRLIAPCAPCAPCATEPAPAVETPVAFEPPRLRAAALANTSPVLLISAGAALAGLSAVSAFLLF